MEKENRSSEVDTMESHLLGIARGVVDRSGGSQKAEIVKITRFIRTGFKRRWDFRIRKEDRRHLHAPR